MLNTCSEKVGAKPNVRPPSAVSPTGRQFRELKFRSWQRHVARTQSRIAYTARAVVIMGGPK